MKVTIEKTANKYSPVILVDGKWLKVADEAFSFAKSGVAEIEKDESGIITKIVMIGEAPKPMSEHSKVASTTTSFHSPQSSLSQQSRERSIVRQVSMKLAVKLIIADKFNLDQLFDTAFSIEKWINREGDGPTS